MNDALRIITGPFALESGTFALLVIVLLTGAVRRERAGRTPAMVTLVGLAALSVLAFIKLAGSSAFGGMFVQDELAIFAKRLFLVSAFLSVDRKSTRLNSSH